MSLINQMLRDLEQRQPKKNQQIDKLEIKTITRIHSGKPKLLWLLLPIAFAIGYVLNHNQPESTPAQTTSIAAPAVNQALPAPTAAQQSQPQQKQQTQAETTAAIATNQAPPAPALAQQSLPQQQQQQQQQTSENTNATQATNQIPSVPNAVLQPQIQPQQQGIRETSTNIHSPKLISPATELPAKKPETIIKPNSKPPIAKPDALIVQANPALPAVKPENSSASIPKIVANLYHQAQISQSAASSRDALLTALALDPHYLPARTLLLQTLLKMHASDAEINAFTEKSLQLFPDNLLFIKTQAHLYVQQKRFNEAIQLLEQIDAKRVEDSGYLSLLAASYQQLQRFPQAERIYQKLTQIQPDKAENWLGWAICLDKLNQPQDAARAYREALNKNTLNSQVVDYINQRLSAFN